MLNEEHFVTGSEDGYSFISLSLSLSSLTPASSISVWNIRKKKPIKTYASAHGAITVGDLGAQQLSGGYDVSSSSYTAAVHPHWIISLAAIRNSDLIASGSSNGSVKLWQYRLTLLFDSLILCCFLRKMRDSFGFSPQGKDLIPLLEVPCSGFVNGLAFAKSGRFLMAGVGKEHRLGRWQSTQEGKNCVRFIPIPLNLGTQ
jgi:ribosomal RNA-processing protein 9